MQTIQVAKAMHPSATTMLLSINSQLLMETACNTTSITELPSSINQARQTQSLATGVRKEERFWDAMAPLVARDAKRKATVQTSAKVLSVEMRTQVMKDPRLYLERQTKGGGGPTRDLQQSPTP